MHTVAILVPDDVVAFDMAVPIEIFGRVRLPDGRRPYRIVVCGASREVAGEAFTISVPRGLEALADADTIIVPGSSEPAVPPPAAVLQALRDAAARGTRIASVCSGAFVLAATGLLDGLGATTHWIAADLLAELHPEVDVRPNVLYVDNGQLLTSAGAAAGVDLCLHMVRRDLGSAVAADIARLSVMPLEREGGQAQFIVQKQPAVPAGSAIEPVMMWIEENLGREITLEAMAARCAMSERTFSRRFREQTGTTPLQWLLRARVRRAQFLLETTDHSVDRIAAQSGFGSPTAFRERFRRVSGTTPHAYRASFRTRPEGNRDAGMPIPASRTPPAPPPARRRAGVPAGRSRVSPDRQVVETVTPSSRTAVGDPAMDPTVFSDSASATSPKIV